jgi:hypothetical protein
MAYSRLTPRGDIQNSVSIHSGAGGAAHPSFKLYSMA